MALPRNLYDNMCDVINEEPMTIRADLVVDDEHSQTELLSFDAAVKRWPWLISYRDVLAAGHAVFWDGRQFSVDTHAWRCWWLTSQKTS